MINIFGLISETNIEDNIKDIIGLHYKSSKSTYQRKKFFNINTKTKEYFEYLIHILIDGRFIEDIWEKKKIEN